MSDFPPISGLSSRSFLIDVGLGLVPGYTTSAVIQRNRNTSSTEFVDIWGGPGNMVWPTASETWEIVSDSAADIADTGLGAWTVLIQSLDDQRRIQPPQIVSLNGTTPVAIGGTHFRAHQLAPTSGALVLTANETATRSNVGTLTVRVAGGGLTRMIVPPDVGKSEDGHITIPAGFTVFSLMIINSWDKDQSGEIYGTLIPSTPNAASVQTGRLPVYQNNLTIIFQAKFQIAETTDHIFKAKSANPGQEVAIITEFLVVENAVVGI